ncbi:MAG: hypothetical protein AB7V32_00330 [Candidatus Berkiella sp.]
MIIQWRKLFSQGEVVVHAKLKDLTLTLNLDKKYKNKDSCRAINKMLCSLIQGSPTLAKQFEKPKISVFEPTLTLKQNHPFESANAALGELRKRAQRKVIRSRSKVNPPQSKKLETPTKKLETVQPTQAPASMPAQTGNKPPPKAIHLVFQNQRITLYPKSAAQNSPPIVPTQIENVNTSELPKESIAVEASKIIPPQDNKEDNSSPSEKVNAQALQKTIKPEDAPAKSDGYLSLDFELGEIDLDFAYGFNSPSFDNLMLLDSEFNSTPALIFTNSREEAPKIVEPEAVTSLLNDKVSDHRNNLKF